MIMNLPDPKPPEPAECMADPGTLGWNEKVRHLSRRAAIASGIAAAWRPATQQILDRPADPLGVSTSYVILRNGIGVLGFALPIVLIVGGGLDHVQGSLSSYYHFSSADPARYGAGMMRDVFVGMLSVIGAFLFFYRGHSLQEDVALNIAGIAAVLVALFPMDWPADAAMASSTAAKLHFACATAFFVMIAYVCVFRARDTLCIMGDPKRRRIFERVYLVFGILMLATPATVVLLDVMSTAGQPGHNTLMVETGGVFVFAAFWLVKSWEIRLSLRGQAIASAAQRLLVTCE